MKRYILSILFLAATIITATAQENNTNVKKLKCEEFKNGHFVLKESLIGRKYSIKRNGDKQIETDPDGTKFIFNVNWVDQCTYTLELKRIARNPNNINWIDGQVITVKILETSDNGYTQKSISNFDDLEFVKEVVMIDPGTYRKNLRGNEIEDDLTLNKQ